MKPQWQLHRRFFGQAVTSCLIALESPTAVAANTKSRLSGNWSIGRHPLPGDTEKIIGSQKNNSTKEVTIARR